MAFNNYTFRVFELKITRRLYFYHFVWYFVRIGSLLSDLRTRNYRIRIGWSLTWRTLILKVWKADKSTHLQFLFFRNIFMVFEFPKTFSSYMKIFNFCGGVVEFKISDIIGFFSNTRSKIEAWIFQKSSISYVSYGGGRCWTTLRQGENRERENLGRVTVKITTQIKKWKNKLDIKFQTKYFHSGLTFLLIFFFWKYM